MTAELKEHVGEGISAWQRFQELAHELADHNRRDLGLGHDEEAEETAR